MQKNKQVLFLAVLFCCLIIDQLSKIIVDNFLTNNGKIILIPNFLSLEKVYNTGAAFSIMQNNTILLILISLATLLLIFSFIFKPSSKLNQLDAISLSLVAGGAVGNLIDRLILSHVIDFIQLEFVKFPIFNFADIFINIGVILLIISSLMFRNEE